MSDTLIEAGSQVSNFLVESATDSAGKVVVDQVVELAAQDIKISIQQVITNETFYAWVILAVVTTLFTSQAWTYRSEIYARLFARPVYIVGIEIGAFVADVLMAASLIYYIWNQRNPPPGQASEWYAAIYALWFTAESLKYFRVILFWRWGLTVAGVCGAALFGGVMNLVLLALAITSGYRQQWVTMVMVLIAWVIYMVAFVCNCIVAWYRTKETPDASLEVNNAVLMTSISRPPMQQQAPQQQQYQANSANRYPPAPQRPPVYGQPTGYNNSAYQRPAGRTMNNGPRS